MKTPASLRYAVEQNADGAIAALVHQDGRATTDYNVFTTALCVREIRRRGLRHHVGETFGRALDYLVVSEDDRWPGAYAYWRPADRPAWAPQLPPDLDDTAVVIQELVAANRLSRTEAKHRILPILAAVRHRPRVDEICAPWMRAGVFKTWIVEGSDAPNIVDCCVNVNAVALLAFLGLKTAPGYVQACKAVNHAVRWSHQDRHRANTICPFYCSLDELARALHHAIESGATELLPAGRLLMAAGFGLAEERDSALFRSAYGSTHWTARSLMAIRRCKAGHETLPTRKYACM